jgi:hypothetical protein
LCEERTEAAEAREADFHADIGHRVIASGEQLLRELDARGDAELMRRDAEDGLELADEVIGRDAHLARELLDRRRRLARFAQQIPGAAKTSKAFVPQQHTAYVVSRRTIAGSVRDAR